MKKEEFLQGLTVALTNEVPPEIVRENLRYYEDYIREEMGKGRSENEIMEELGSPRLIARTIIDTTPGSGSYIDRDNAAAGGFTGTDSRESYQQSGSVRHYDLNKWYWKLLALVILIAVITLILMIVGGILSLVIPMLPVIGMVLLIMWFVRGGSGPRK